MHTKSYPYILEPPQKAQNKKGGVWLQEFCFVRPCTTYMFLFKFFVGVIRAFFTISGPQATTLTFSVAPLMNSSRRCFATPAPLRESFRHAVKP